MPVYLRSRYMIYIDISQAISNSLPQSQLCQVEIDPKILNKSYRQSLGESISYLIRGGNKIDFQTFLLDPISHKMLIHLNVFCSSMEHRIA